MAIRIPILWRNEDSGLRQAQASVSNFSTVAAGAFAYIGAMAVQGMAQAARAVVDYGIEAAKAAAESDSVARGLEQIAKNSSAFSATTSNLKAATTALTDHSTKMSKLIGIDDEVLNSMKRTWLAVPELAGRGADGINKLAEVAADVAAGTGKDIESIGQAFIKVSGDEETALSKLRRAGIVLSDQQNATYQQILDTNGQIAAQDYLIETLGQTYKGAAEAAANPFERVKAILEDLQERIGAAFMPALEAAIPKIQEFADKLVADPVFQSFLSSVTQNFTDMIPVIYETVQNLIPLIESQLPTINEILPSINSLMEALASAIKLTGDSATDSYGPLGDLIIAAGLLGDAADWAFTSINNLKGSLGGGWGPVVDSIIQTLTPLQRTIEIIIGGLAFITGNKEVATQMATGKSMKQLENAYNQRTKILKSYPGQADGGVTTRAGLSWVGENGPELLSLPVGAQVTPLDKVSGSGGSTYNINISTLKADASIGEIIVNSIQRYERSSGPVFAKA